MKKILLFFLMLTLFFSVFANGKKETIRTENIVESISLGESVSNQTIIEGSANIGNLSILRKTANMIAVVLNRLTVRFSLALSPFPSITTKFYQYIDNQMDIDLKSFSDSSIDYTEEDLLLRADSYVTNNNVIQNYSQYLDDSETQQRRWGFIFWLVFALTVLEMLYVLVIPQPDKGGESVDLKTIIVKFLQSFLLILLLAALPYLLEVTRLGFSEIVSIFSKQNNEKFTMVSMPGYFVSRMGELTAFLDPESVAGDSYELATAGRNVIGKALIGLVYLLFQFYMLVMIVRAGVQIMVKLIEVYLFLTVCMITLPFSVFTPLKSVGEKCVLSLVSNTIECFIIALILAIVLPVSNAVLKPLLQALSEAQQPQIWQVSYYDTLYHSDDLDSDSDIPLITTITNTIAIDDQGIIVNLYTYRPGLSPTDQIYTFYVNREGGNCKSTNSKAFKYMSKRWTNSKAEDWIIVDIYNDGYPEAILEYENSALSQEYEIIKLMYSAIRNSIQTALKDICLYNFNISNAKATVQSSCLSLITIQPLNVPGGRRTFVDSFFKSFEIQTTNYRMKMDDESFNYVPGDNTFSEKNSFLIQHMILCFLAIYIPYHFVRQSSAITAAILSGSTTQGSASDEVGRGIDRAGRVMRETASIFGNIARAGVIMMTKGRGNNIEAGNNSDSPQSNARGNQQ